MKNVFLVGYYGYGNFGDEVLFDVFSQGLKEKDADITVLGNVKEYKNVPKKSFIKIVKQIKKSDVIFFGGGGLFQDTTSFASFLYYAMILKFSVFFKKQVVFAFIGVDRFRFTISKIIFSLLLNMADIKIIVRDNESAEYLKKIGVKKPVKVSADPSFCGFIESDNRENILGINIRDINGFWNKTKFDNLYSLISSRLSNYDSVVFYILDKNNEEKFVDEFNREYDLHADKVYIDHNNYSEVFSCSYLITMRYHLLLLSVVNMIPCLSVYYDTKLQYAAKEFCIPATDLTDIKHLDFSCTHPVDVMDLKSRVDGDLFELYMEIFGEKVS